MDPNACYRDMIDAHRSGDHETAADRAESLVIWLQRGGFPPAGLTRYETHHKAYDVIHAACQAGALNA